MKMRSFSPTEKGTIQPFNKFIFAVNAISPDEFGNPDSFTLDGKYAEVYTNFVVLFPQEDITTITATTERGVQLMNQIATIEGEIV